MRQAALCSLDTKMGRARTLMLVDKGIEELNFGSY